MPRPHQLGHAPTVRDQARTPAGEGLQHDGRPVLEPEAGDHEQVRRGERSSDAVAIEGAPDLDPVLRPERGETRLVAGVVAARAMDAQPGPGSDGLLQAAPRVEQEVRSLGGDEGPEEQELQGSALAPLRAVLLGSAVVASSGIPQPRGHDAHEAPVEPERLGPGAEEGTGRNDGLDVALHRVDQGARPDPGPPLEASRLLGVDGREGRRRRATRSGRRGQQVHARPASHLPQGPGHGACTARLAPSDRGQTAPAARRVHDLTQVAVRRAQLPHPAALQPEVV